MKKLLTTAAICGLAVSATPAQADIDLELGGYMKPADIYVTRTRPLRCVFRVNTQIRMCR